MNVSEQLLIKAFKAPVISGINNFNNRLAFLRKCSALKLAHRNVKKQEVLMCTHEKKFYDFILNTMAFLYERRCG